MKNNLGEIFCDGKIISLDNSDENALQDLLIKVRNDKIETKENIETIMEKYMINFSK